MVMPRSRSRSIESRTCSSISRSDNPPQSWMMRSASVDLPWSIWAMIEKLRICCIRKKGTRRALYMWLSKPEIVSDFARERGGFAAIPAGPRSCSVAVQPQRHVQSAVAAPDQQRHALGLVVLIEQLGQLLDGFDVLVVERHEDVAPADSGLGRSPLHVFHQQPAADTEFLALLRGQLAYRQAEPCDHVAALAVAAARALGHFLLGHLAYRDAHIFGRALAPDLHRDLGTRSGLRDHARQVGGRVHRFAVEFEDHVGRLEPRLVRRAAFLHRIDQRASRLR